MNMSSYRFLPSLLGLVAIAGCYGDKVFVEDGAGGSPTSNPTGGNPPQSGGNGAGGNGAGTTGGEAPGGSGGGPSGCTGPEDCPTPATDCIEAVCDETTCGEQNKPEGSSCNGGRCDGQGSCVECLDNSYCTPPETCDPQSHECAPPACMNGSLDAGETDVDCGGTSCPPCLNNDSCLVGSDCVSGFCGPGLVCTACSDNAQCPATDFCQGGICTLKLNDGSACLNNAQCGNGNCVATSAGGICCNSACNGTCQSCAMTDTGQPNGVCSNVTPNTDPLNECPTVPCRTGNCGIGACGVSAVNTPCDDGIFCNGTDTCDGSGACNHSGNPCPPDAIPDFNCSESCNEANDNCTAADPVGTPCTDGFFCTGSSDTCNGTGTCVGGGNPCNGPLCTDGCNEAADACNQLQAAGSQCNADGDGLIGMCSTSGACLND